MTKVKLKEVTMELNTQVGNLLVDAERVRRNADTLIQTLRRQEAHFLRAEEENQKQLKLEQQKSLSKQHPTAWTMPDEEEDAVFAAEPPVAAARVEVKAPIITPVVPEPAMPALQTVNNIVSVEVSAAPIAEEIPAAIKPAVAAPAAQAAQPVEDARPAEPALESSNPMPANAGTKAAVGSAQADQPVTRPAAPAQPVLRPAAPIQQYPRPAAGVQHPGAPVPGSQPYARPATGAPYTQGTGVQPNRPAYTGPRPFVPAAGSQPFNRPAGASQPFTPNQGAQQYPRPAGQPFIPAQSGQPFRSAGPAQPFNRTAPGGQPFRSAGPAQPFNRPVPGAQPYGRPITGAPQYGRPMQGTGPRPAGTGTGMRPGGMQRPGMNRAHATELAPTIEKERVSNYDPNKKNYVRQHDPEHIVKNKKQMVKESFTGYDDDVVRSRKRAKKPSAQQLMAPIRIEKAYMTADTITVKDLTERIGKPAGDILKKLLMIGAMSTINSELDFDTASLVCSEFGVELEMKLDKTAEDYLSETNFTDEEEALEIRPPVVTIMGHVDHGKTSLLDFIRSANVTKGEAGGITQHIGAYTITLKDHPITFLDTPGHEAFTAMRARGAQATDIAVLVVAADDGVMPQTIEAINHAKAANVPIIVAINKMDKAGANPERVKQDLTAYNLVAEEWGGDTIIAPVSAVTGEGVDQLLELILLQAEVLQLRANPNRPARGVIIEAKLDKSRGPLATVLLKNGTLHIGDNIVAGAVSGRVRALVNDRGERLQQAGPSMPVEIAGFNDVPSAGDEMMAVDDDRLSRLVAQERRDKEKASRTSSVGKVSLDNLFAGIAEGKVKNLNLIIKADVQGSVEAVKQALEKLSNEEVKVRVLHSGVGAINKDDVNLASAFDAIIIGFNIRPDSGARDAAERDEIDIRLYRIIYQAIEDIEKALKGMLTPKFREILLGHSEVRNVFKITGSGTVAGCYVTDGKMQRNASVRLLRDNVVVFEGKLSSLRRFKDDVREVGVSYECGISLEGYNDIKEGDIIECFEQEEILR
jgi:translation initiation factor IF-2